MKKIISFTPLATVLLIGLFFCQVESNSASLMTKAATATVKPTAAPVSHSINRAHFSPLYCPQ